MNTKKPNDSHLFPNGCFKCGSPWLKNCTGKNAGPGVVQYRCDDCQTVNTASRTAAPAIKPVETKALNRIRNHECE